MPAIPRVSHRRILYSSPRGIDDAWRLRAEVETPLKNGIGRFVCQLKRLTYFFDRAWDNSAGVREFIKEDLEQFAQSNPEVALYVVPKRRKAPYMVGEYMNGREARVHLAHMRRDQVAEWTEYFRNRSGQRIAAFERDWRTEAPSVQGPWHPFLNIPFAMNTEPLPKHVPHTSPHLSATEIVRKLMAESAQQ